MVILVNHTSTQTDLSALLVNIQPQLKESDDIYIVSQGPGVAKRHGSTRTLILIEVGKYSPNEALQIGIEFATKNNHEGVLYLESNLVLSHTFIHNLRKASKLEYQMLSPQILTHIDGRINPNFTWFNYGDLIVEPVAQPNMICRYIDSAPKEKMFGLIKNEKVAVL